MPWDENLTNLKYVLADLYFLKEDSIPVIRDIGLRPSHITFRDKAVNNWSEILDAAEKAGKVPDLIRRALIDAPNNQFLLSAQNGTLTPVKPIIGDDFTWKGSQPPETLEKIIGRQSTLLPINWLEIGIQRSRSIAKIKRADHTFGSGFLIKNNLLLTNNHVLPDKDIARQAIAIFNDQQNAEGLNHEPVDVRLDPDTFFQTSHENDWTVVYVHSHANAEWGSIEINPIEVKVNDWANIIQHPGGGAKHIALYHNTITYVDKTRVHYLTDTLPGSSGSAVFDSQWRLIAVHHSGGLLTEPTTKKSVYRNEGININCILHSLDIDNVPSPS